MLQVGGMLVCCKADVYIVKTSLNILNVIMTDIA